MRKKYLSALLFGALVMASTATFTSCKDYDDDIENLQGQINSNKDAIAALQKLVGQGKWVAGISAIENGFTVTMSDGSTQTVKGINGKDGANGKDGKDGTQWTISEDGFWVCDGEKTEFVAVGKDGANGENGQDGKNGLTAPSPQISANGNWIVYTFNEATGEFDAEETAFSAVGTAAYVVAKDNTYELHIADQNGQYQEIVLPATSDAFVATAPYSKVIVKFEKATWNKWNANKDDAKTLLAKFPELANIEKNAPVKQGGNLPLIISPADVELTDAYSFSLQGLDGKTADILIGSPVKGLPMNTEIEQPFYSAWFDYNNDGIKDLDEIYTWKEDAMVTRSAENDCFWTVKIDPAYDEKKNQYAEVENASLVVANAKGTTMKTAFAYTVDCDQITDDVAIYQTNYSHKYAPTIDVLARQDENKPAIFTLSNEYVGYVVLEATNPVQVEKYQLTTEGGKLHIGNMPANETGINVTVKITALGLNGSVKSATSTIYISQAVSAEASLSEKAITLDKNAVKVRWNISELGMTAVQLDQFATSYINLTATRDAVEDDGQEKHWIAYNGGIKYYNEKGDALWYNNGVWRRVSDNVESTVATFGIDVTAQTLQANYNTSINGTTYSPEMWMPEDYTVTLTAQNGPSVIFAATTALKVANPEASASYIRLVPGFVENGVYQITGDYLTSTTQVTYKLEDAFIMGNTARLVKYVDLDAWNFVDNGGNTDDKSLTGSYNWLTSAQAIADGTEADDLIKPSSDLYVNKWEPKPTPTPTGWYAAEHQQLYKERNIRAFYTLFNNPKNVMTFDFKVVVKSEIYNEDATKAIEMNDAKLSAVFGGENNTDKIDIKAAVTKAIVAAGTDKGKTYDLFGKAGGTTTPKVVDYNDPAVNGDYVVNSAGKPIAIEYDDLLDFGMPMADFIGWDSADKVYLKKAQATGDKVKGWDELYAVWSTYYTVNTSTGAIELLSGATAPAAGTPAAKDIALFNKYKSKIKFSETNGTPQITSATPADARIKKVVIAFKDPAVATNYFFGVANNGIVIQTNADGIIPAATIQAVTNAPTDVTDGKVTVPMVIKVTDQWGMTMVREFNVTVKTN